VTWSVRGHDEQRTGCRVVSERTARQDFACSEMVIADWTVGRPDGVAELGPVVPALEWSVLTQTRSTGVPLHSGWEVGERVEQVCECR
jgi:hypothetical protein